MKISEAVANRISELLKEKHMTKYRLYMDAGISKSTLTGIMKNWNKSVNLETIINIVRTLNISLSEFFNTPLFDDGNLICD